MRLHHFSWAAAFIASTAQAQPQPPPPTTQPLSVPDAAVTPRDVPSDQLLRVTGSLSLRVEELDPSAQSLQSSLEALGGRLRGRDDRILSFDVPRTRFPEAIEQAASIGVELDRSVEVVDRTPAYLELLAQLRSAQQTRNRIAGLHRGVSGVKDPLRVESALSQWDNRIAELGRRLRELRQQTSMAAIRVELHPTVAAIHEDVPPFRLPFPWLDDLSLQRLTDFDGGTSSSRPEDGGIQSDAEIDLELRVLRASDEVLYGGNETAMAAGWSMRGVGETTPIGFAAGGDFALGGGFSGGFLYNLRLVGGFGTGISDFIAIGLVSGVGAGGLTGGYVPFGLEFPVEAFAAVEVGDLVRAGTWARTSWIVASDDRQDGSDTAPFGDEFSTGLTMLFGEASGTADHSRTGLSLKGAYHELMGTHAYEVSLGVGFSFLELERYH